MNNTINNNNNKDSSRNWNVNSGTNVSRRRKIQLENNRELNRDKSNNKILINYT